MVDRLLPDRGEAARRLAAHLGPDGDGVLGDPPADQLRWSRPDAVVPGWVQWAVQTLTGHPEQLRAAARPVTRRDPAGDPGGEVALWCSAPGWTALARVRADGTVPVAVLVCDAHPGAVTDLTVPRLAGPVTAALRDLAASAAGGGAQPDPLPAGP